MIINCRTLTELLTEASETSLPAFRRTQVALHLKVCSFCRAHRAQYDTTVAILRAMPREPPPDELLDTLVARLPRKM
jgi:hypothetical protein